MYICIYVLIILLLLTVVLVLLVLLFITSMNIIIITFFDIASDDIIIDNIIPKGKCTVGSHNLHLRNFESRVSNPRAVAYFRFNMPF